MLSLKFKVQSQNYIFEVKSNCNITCRYVPTRLYRIPARFIPGLNILLWDKVCQLIKISLFLWQISLFLYHIPIRFRQISWQGQEQFQKKKINWVSKILETICKNLVEKKICWSKKIDGFDMCQHKNFAVPKSICYWLQWQNAICRPSSMRCPNLGLNHLLKFLL